MHDELLTVKEAICLLYEYRIDHSEQMLRRWLRQGKIKGFRSTNRKEGWRIPAAEVWQIIEDQQWVGTAYEREIDDQTRIDRLLEEVMDLKKQIEELENENMELREKLGEIIF
jgi:predicted site-specific integrase-resolvase